MSTHSQKKICPIYNGNAVNEIIDLNAVVYIVETFAGSMAFTVSFRMSFLKCTVIQNKLHDRFNAFGISP